MYNNCYSLARVWAACEYMLNYIVRAGDCHVISWLQFV